MKRIRHRDKLFKRYARKRLKAKGERHKSWLEWWYHFESY